jgi:hypothetical protein
MNNLWSLLRQSWSLLWKFIKNSKHTYKKAHVFFGTNLRSIWLIFQNLVLHIYKVDLAWHQIWMIWVPIMVEAPIWKSNLFRHSIKASTMSRMNTQINTRSMNHIHNTIEINGNNCFWWTYIRITNLSSIDVYSILCQNQKKKILFIVKKKIKIKICTP